MNRPEKANKTRGLGERGWASKRAEKECRRWARKALPTGARNPPEGILTIIDAEDHPQGHLATYPLRVQSAPFVPHTRFYAWFAGTCPRGFESQNGRIEAFLLKRRGLHWENLPCPKLKMKDISAHEVKRFKDLAIDKGRLDRSVRSETKAEFISNLHLVGNEGLSFAAALLFSEKAEKWIPGAVAV